MALFRGDVLIAGTNPSGGGGAGGGHIIQDSTGEEIEQRPALQFIGADVVDDDINEATQVITPSFREIQGDIPDTPVVCLDGAPIGAIIPYGAPISTLDANWLPCLGQAVSRVIYHELFAKIGTTYGAGDGSTTFNLPNFNGKVAVGLDSNDSDFDTLGETGGEKTHTLTTTEIPSHKHEGLYWLGDANRPMSLNSGSNANGYQFNWASTADSAKPHTGLAGGGQAHNNLQPYIVTNYIIKAKQASTAVLQGTINNTYNNKINEVYSSSYINSNIDSKFNYSTNLSIIGYWINNKPIYRKVFSPVTLPSVATWTNTCNMTSDNVEDIIKIYGTFKGADGRQMMIQQTEDGVNVTASYLNGYIQIKTTYNSWYGRSGFIIVEFTKTTD